VDGGAWSGICLNTARTSGPEQSVSEALEPAPAVHAASPASCLAAAHRLTVRRNLTSTMGSKARPVRNADNLAALDNDGSSTSHNPVGPHGLLLG
jgi:hypothetical protein